MGKGFDTFMENPYWKGVYENAPSDELREYYRIMFDASPFIGENGDAGSVDMARLDDILIDERGIEYLLGHAGSPQAKMFYQKCLDAIAGEGEGTCIVASSLKGELRNPFYTPKG